MYRNNRHMRRRIQQRQEEMDRDEEQAFFWHDIKFKRQDQLKKYLDEKLARQRATSQQKPQDQIKSGTEDQSKLALLPYDLLFQIFILLPAESLSKLQFVCKKWFDLINSSSFIESQTQQSETVLYSQELFLKETPRPSWLVMSEKAKPHFHYVDFIRGNDNFLESSVINMIYIRASYDGLIVGTTNEKKSFILMNPLTRKHTELPSGTIGFHESYGLAFCSEEKTYKVVHLFREPSGYTGCEILSVNTKKWTVMEGPDSDLLPEVRLMPVSAWGSLNWMTRGHGRDSFLSLSVRDKKFASKKLPIICTSNDRLVEITGVLGFVTHATLNLMQVWILTKSGGANEKWIKRYSIYLSFDVRLIVPICSSRNGKEMVFEYPGNNLYVYNFETGKMKKVYSRDDERIHSREGAEKIFVPHRNTLISWDHRES